MVPAEVGRCDANHQRGAGLATHRSLERRAFRVLASWACDPEASTPGGQTYRARTACLDREARPLHGHPDSQCSRLAALPTVADQRRVSTGFPRTVGF
jgi:hypothetical protein